MTPDEMYTEWKSMLESINLKGWRSVDQEKYKILTERVEAYETKLKFERKVRVLARKIFIHSPADDRNALEAFEDAEKFLREAKRRVDGIET